MVKWGETKWMIGEARWNEVWTTVEPHTVTPSTSSFYHIRFPFSSQTTFKNAVDKHFI